MRGALLEQQSELIRAAGDAGVSIAVVHPSSGVREDLSRQQRLENSMELLAQLTAVAQKAGIVLAVENLPRTGLCRVKEEMQQILAAIPDLRVCFDSNHCLLQTNPDYIRAVGDKIVTLHISDYDFINERHLLPGRGNNYWENLLESLEEENYQGVFNYEVARKDSSGRIVISLTDIQKNYQQLINGRI